MRTGRHAPATLTTKRINALRASRTGDTQSAREKPFWPRARLIFREFEFLQITLPSLAPIRL